MGKIARMDIIPNRRTSLAASESNNKSAVPYVGNNIALQPEFGDAKKVRAIFDISKTHLYRLEEAGLIESVSVRGRGKTKGRRLYNIASIRSFLYELMGEKAQRAEAME